jgi:hypothetical protein
MDIQIRLELVYNLNGVDQFSYSRRNLVGTGLLHNKIHLGTNRLDSSYHIDHSVNKKEINLYHNCITFRNKNGLCTLQF